MQELLDLIEKLARSLISVIILGETGTGKDVLAKALHAASLRPGPFVALNCAVLPITLTWHPSQGSC